MSILSELVCSRVRAEILRILFDNAGITLHLREIQRRAGLSLGTVQQDLAKLVRLGLVTRRQDGNRVNFAANHDHPLYIDLHRIVIKTVGLADVLRSALAFDGIRVAFVFGSMADGTAGPTSDVDLFVVGEPGLRQIVGMLTGASDQLGRIINPITMTGTEFARRVRDREHFLTSVMAGPKIFVVGSEHDLGAMVPEWLAEGAPPECG